MQALSHTGVINTPAGPQQIPPLTGTNSVPALESPPHSLSTALSATRRAVTPLHTLLAPGLSQGIEKISMKLVEINLCGLLPSESRRGQESTEQTLLSKGLQKQVLIFKR